MNNVEEVWKPVVGYENLYSVSNLGQVRSEGRVITRIDGRRCTYASKILKTSLNPHYLTVGLTDIHGNTRTKHIHSLVLTAFVGPRPENSEACHNDGNKLNNSANNLRWDSRIGNLADKLIHGTSNFGERNGSAKLTSDQVLSIRSRRKDGLSYSQLGKEFGISMQTAHRIVCRELWRHI